MNESIPLTDASDEILTRFVQELAESDDPTNVVARFQAAYPVLASQFPAMAGMMAKIEDASPDADADTDLPPCLGGFRLIRRIAQGGMGEVFEALEERLQRRVAVKIVHRQHCSPALRVRFLREQLVLAGLHQTHIVPIFAAGEQGPFQYFAMPYIEGAALHNALDLARQPRTTWPDGKLQQLSTLAEMYAANNGTSTQVASSGNRPQVPPTARDVASESELVLSRSYFRSVAEVMADVAQALHHAHTARIIHRDVKPSNIMIGRDGKSWIIDFGLAGFRRTADSVGGIEDAFKQSVSAELASEPIAITGVVGTRQYMAPEQWTNPDQVDAPADVWGLGATLYELLTLQPAFQGASDAEVREKVLTTSPAPPSRRMRGVPRDLDAICLKALRKQPEQRYSTAEDFAEDLRRWLRDEPPIVVRARRWRQLGSWASHNKAWAASLGMLLLVVFGGLFGWGLLAQTEADAAKRSILLLELQQIRLSDHDAGWSIDALNRASTAAKLGVEDNLRLEAAAALAGLDAVKIADLAHGASAIAWDREGKRLLMVSGENGTASLWDSNRYEEMRFEYTAAEGPVAFLDDGTPVQLVADPSDRWTVVLWDIGKSRRIREFKIPPGGDAAAAGPLNPVMLAMTSNGAVVAAVTSEVDQHGNTVRGHFAAWDSATAKMLLSGESQATALALSPDGTVLAAGDAAGRTRLWSLTERKELEPLSSGRAEIDCLAFGRNPRVSKAGEAEPAISPWLLATGGKGGTVHVWDLGKRQVKSRCQSFAWGVYTLAFSPDGMTLASAGHGGEQLWDIASGRSLLKKWGSDWAKSVAFSPEGRLLAVCSDMPREVKRGVKVYRLENGRGGMQSLRGLMGPIAHVRFSLDGRLVAALSHNWEVALWDTEANRLLQLLDVPTGVFADNADLCFSPDGKRFAFASGTQAKMWEVESGRELESWALPPGLADRIAFRSESDLVLFRTETADGKPPWGAFPWRAHPRVCRIRHLSRPNQMNVVAQITAFNKRVYTAAIAPDGSYIVAAGVGGPNGDRQSIRIYDGASGQEVGTLPVNRTEFDPILRLDALGRLLAYTPDNDDPTKLVDIPSGKLRSTLPGAPRSLGPGGNYWVSVEPGPGFTLFRTQDGTPLVVIGIDDEVTGEQQFSSDGSRWAWGLDDGGVTVCDIAAVQRRLTEIGLGR